MPSCLQTFSIAVNWASLLFRVQGLGGLGVQVVRRHVMGSIALLRCILTIAMETRQALCCISRECQGLVFVSGVPVYNYILPCTHTLYIYTILYTYIYNIYICIYTYIYMYIYIYICYPPPPPHELPQGAAIPSPILLRVGFWCMIQF